MRCDGYDVINYMDDFVGIGVSSVARCSFEHLHELLARLGLDVSERKLVSPSTKVTCLGIKIDSVAKTVSIPKEKMKRVHVMLQDWQTKLFASKQQLQSLLGNLLYIHKCVKPARIFVNRMLEVLRQNFDKRSITLTPEFKRDV